MLAAVGKQGRLIRDMVSDKTKNRARVQKIRVKFISKNGIRSFQLFDLPQQFPECEFMLERDAPDYDWLVVYDDLPARGGERLSLGVEELACPKENTVLMTYEPSSVKFYGTDYVNQYGMVLTSHPPSALPHTNRRDVPPVGVWYYGGLEQMQAHPEPPQKNADISIFVSRKQQKHTLHQKRFEFTQDIQDGLAAQLHVFGHGHHYVEHKAEALNSFRYHIAVENHISPHHWTEKLSDCFLGYCLPFYAGCPNAADYFPEESFIAIDIRDSQAALATIRVAVTNGEYERRLPAIAEARRRVIEDYNLGNMVARHIVEAQPVVNNMGNTDNRQRSKVLSRHAMMRRDLPTFLRYAFGKVRARWQNSKYWRNYLAR